MQAKIGIFTRNVVASLLVTPSVRKKKSYSLSPSPTPSRPKGVLLLDHVDALSLELHELLSQIPDLALEPCVFLLEARVLLRNLGYLFQRVLLRGPSA